ncbi:MAG: hypothetical protein RQ729_03295 [Wenzhouxiangellaceae bacterium]|nr:hypothetical protein [Wenzhouxiangellaceae bacterium]
MSHPADNCQFALQLLPVGGPDAAALLQALVTADIEALEPGRARAAALCAPNGRAEAVFLLVREPDRLGLIVPQPISPVVARKLQMFRIGRKVEVFDTVPVCPCAPDEAGAWPLAHDPQRALRADPDGKALPLPETWWAADIAAGMPWLLPETAGQFLPQMLGLEELEGLSYRKGCFPGQEVIARVHYRGRVTRRTVRFTLDGGEARPGDPVTIADGEGMVLYTAQNGKGGVTGLAVVPAETTATDTLTIGEVHGRVLEN